MFLQLTEEQKRGRMQRCLHMLRKFDVGRSERVRYIVTNNETFFFFFCIPVCPGNRTTVYSLAFPKWEPTCEIQEIEKRFQTGDRGLLHQMRSCGLCPAPGEEDSQGWVVHQHLLAQGLWGLECTPSKRWRQRPAAPPRQPKCPHRVQLVTQTPYFLGVAPCDFFSVPSSEAAVGGETVSGRRRCSSLLRGRDFWHTSVNVVWRHGHVVLKGWPSVCMLRGLLQKKWTRSEIHTCAQISTFKNWWGAPRISVWPAGWGKIFISAIFSVENSKCNTYLKFSILRFYLLINATFSDLDKARSQLHQQLKLKAVFHNSASSI